MPGWGTASRRVANRAFRSISLIQTRKKSVRTHTRTRTPSVKVQRRGASFLRGSSVLLRVSDTITGILLTNTSTILY